MESKNEFYLLAIVAIVAIVGIIVLVMGAKNAPAATTNALGGDMAGQAYARNCAGCLAWCETYWGHDCMENCQAGGFCASGAQSSGN